MTRNFGGSQENIFFFGENMPKTGASARQKEKIAGFCTNLFWGKFSRKQKDSGDFRKYENAVVKHIVQKKA
jgi:hypothetical protein